VSARLPGSPRSRVALALVLILSIPLLGAVQLVRQGRTDLAASDAALASGNLDAAIADARRASLAEVPFVGADGEGYARLTAIARAAEERSDEDHALKAWSAVRAAALASDGLVSRDAELHAASTALARLYTRRAHEAAAAAGPQLAAAPVPDEASLARSLEDAAPSFATRARRALGFTAAALLMGGILLFFLRSARGARTTSSDTGPAG
jgi:hypothetical protein